MSTEYKEGQGTKDIGQPQPERDVDACNEATLTGDEIDTDHELISRIDSEATSSITSLPFVEMDDWALSTGESEAEDGWVRLRSSDLHSESVSDLCVISEADMGSSGGTDLGSSIGTLGSSSPPLVASENSLRMPTFGLNQHEDLCESTKHLFSRSASPNPNTNLQGQLRIDNIKLRILVTGDDEKGISRFVKALLKKSTDVADLNRRKLSPWLSEWLVPLKSDQQTTQTISHSPQGLNLFDGVENLSILEHHSSPLHDKFVDLKNIVESRAEETFSRLKSSKVKDAVKELMHSKVSDYPLIDCCIYLFRESYPSQADITAYKALTQFVDVIPVIVQTTLSLAERKIHEATVRNRLHEAGIYLKSTQPGAVASSTNSKVKLMVYVTNACGDTTSLTERDRDDIDELACMLLSPEFMRDCHKRAIEKGIVSTQALPKKSPMNCCQSKGSATCDKKKSTVQSSQICVQCQNANSATRRQLQPIDNVDPLGIAKLTDFVPQISVAFVLAVAAVSFVCGVKYAVNEVCPVTQSSFPTKFASALTRWWK